MLFLIERAKKDGQEDSAIIKILTIKFLLYCFYLHKSNEKFIFSSCASWGWCLCSRFSWPRLDRCLTLKQHQDGEKNILTCQIFYSLSQFQRSGLFPIVTLRGGSQRTDVYGSRNMLNMAKEVDEWKVKYILQSWNAITRLEEFTICEHKNVIYIISKI